MADGEHAAVPGEVMQPPDGDAMIDRALTQAEREQLLPRDELVSFSPDLRV